MNRYTTVALVLVLATLALHVVGLDAQRGRGAPPGGPGGPGRGARATAGTIERVTVHGKALEAGRALEGNAPGDSPDRAVTVYLPPSYAGDQKRRFPTVYLLHGAGGSDSTFLEGAALQASADRLAGAEGFSEFIVVTPNASTQKGSMPTRTRNSGSSSAPSAPARPAARSPLRCRRGARCPRCRRRRRRRMPQRRTRARRAPSPIGSRTHSAEVSRRSPSRRSARRARARRRSKPIWTSQHAHRPRGVSRQPLRRRRPVGEEAPRP